MLDAAGSTYLGFRSQAAGNGVELVGQNVDAAMQPIGPDQIDGSFLACGAGIGPFTAYLETPEAVPTEPIPSVGTGFSGPPVGRPGCVTTAFAAPIRAIAACFTRDHGLYVSTGRVRANGIDITPTSGGEVVIDPAIPSISSRGGAVDVRAGPVLLYRGALNVDAQRPVVLDVQIGGRYSIADNEIGGLPITGSVQLTLDPAGSTEAEVSVTLPKPFDSAEGTVNFSATNADGLVLNGIMLNVDSVQLIPFVAELTDISFGVSKADDGAVHWDGGAMVYLPIPRGSRCAKLPVFKGVNLNHRSGSILKNPGAYFRDPGRLLLQTGVGVSAGFGISDGYFHLGVNVDGLNCYLAYGVFLQRLAVGGGVNPLTVTMGAGLSLGPQLKLPIVGKLEAASLDGTQTLTLASHDELTTDWTGTLKLGLSTFAGELQLSPAGADLSASGDYAIVPIPGTPRTRSTMTGWVERSAFNLDGTGDLILPGFDLKTNTVISSEGCHTGFGPDVGWGYRWGDSTISWFSHSCGVGAYRVARSERSANAAQAAGPSSFQIPAGKRVATFAAVGTDQPPVVQLTGPGVDLTTNPASATSTAQALTLPDTASHTTYIALDRPRGGSYTVTAVTGSPPVTQVLSAQSVDAVHVRAHISGEGVRRRLIYRATGLAGATLAFSERGGGQRHLATTRHARGVVALHPPPGHGERHTVIVTVLRDGVPEPAVTVASYRPAPTPRAPAPKRLRIHRTRSGRLITWTGPTQAGYVVRARPSDGRHLRWEITGNRLTITPLGPATRLRVSVQQLDALGRPGRAATTRG